MLDKRELFYDTQHDLEIVIESSKKDISEMDVFLEQFAEFSNKYGFTNKIIFQNIKEIKESISQLSQIDENISDIFNKSLNNIYNSIHNNILSMKEFETTYTNFIKNDYTNDNSRLKDSIIECTNIIKNNENEISDIQQGLRDFKEQLTNQIKNIYNYINESTNSQNKDIANTVNDINLFNKNIITNFKTDIDNKKTEILELLETKINNLSDVFSIDHKKTMMMLNDSMKNIELKLSEKIDKDDIIKLENYLDIHLSEILNETELNKSTIMVLENKIQNINNLLIERIESQIFNGNNDIITHSESDLKSLVEDIIKSVRLELLHELDHKISDVRRVNDNVVEIIQEDTITDKQIVEDVCDKLNRTYDFKIKQIKTAIETRFSNSIKKLETQIKQLISDKKTISNYNQKNKNNNITHNDVKTYIETYLRDNPITTNYTPEHKYDGDYIFFKQPNGEWGHGIRVNYSSLNGAGFSYDTSTAQSQSNLKIYKDNIKIDEQISNINFIGNNILVKKNTNNDNWVDIYISSQNQNIQYTDNFNVGSTAIQQIVGTSRNVASPNGTSYDIGDWVAGESHPCINKDIIEFTTSNVYSFENENSTVGCRILNGSGIVIKELEVMNIGNHTTSDDDCIFITNSDYDQEYDRFVAKTEFVIHLNKILLNGGRFSVQLYNNNDTIGNYEFVQTNLFYDKQSYGGSIGNISISENVPIIKYLSGVAYYTIGSSFNLSILNIDNINDKSYPNEQLRIDGSAIGLPFRNLTGSDLAGWNTNFDVSDCNYITETFNIANINVFKKVVNGKCIVSINDWGYGNGIESNGGNYLVDTIANNSSNVFEGFNTEAYRLMSDLTTSWDSSDSLLNIDDNTGLLCQNSLLMYPNDDYTIFQPNASEQPVYVGLNGWRSFYRKMYTNNYTYSNGVITLVGSGINESNFNNKFRIYWTIDKNNWYSLMSDYVGGVLNSGDGSRVNRDTLSLNNSTKQIAFTMGETKFSNTIYWKIEMIDDSVSIDSLSLNWI